MGIKTTLQLINLELNTHKEVQIDKINNTEESVRNEGVKRSISLDINLKKAFGLLGLWIGVVNSHIPEVVFEFIKSMMNN